MKNVVSRWIVGLLVATQVAKADPPKVNPKAMVARIGVGANAVCRDLRPVTNPPTGDPVWETRFATDIKNAGFDSIRLWAKPSEEVTGPAPNYTVSNAYWVNIEKQINDSLSEGLVVILVVDEKWHGGSYNQHGRPGNTTAQKNAIIDRIVKFWAQASKRWENKSENLIYQILNEPIGRHGIDWDMPNNTVYLNLLNRSVAAIRANDLTRNITFFARDHSDISTINPKLEVPSLNVPGDDFYFGSQHGYPRNQFHSLGNEDWGPSSAQITEMNQYFARITKFVTNQGRHTDGKEHPVAITEFGTRNTAAFGINKDKPIAETERAQYCDYIVNRARDNQIAILVHSAMAAGNGGNFSIYKHRNAPASGPWIYPLIRNAITKHANP